MHEDKPALNYAKRIGYSSGEVVDHVYETTLNLVKDGVHGCYVECGVAAGSKVIAMAAALRDSKTPNTIFAYDSFEGIPLPTKNDDQQPGIKYLTEEEMKELPDDTETDKFLKSSGSTVHSIDNFYNNVKAAIGLKSAISCTVDEVKYIARIQTVEDIDIIAIKGWFENTVKSHQEKIAYLRLDGDMYSATKVCLTHLYPLLTEGAILEIDDYALAGCRKAVEEYFEGQDIEWLPVPNSTVVYMVK